MRTWIVLIVVGVVTAWPHKQATGATPALASLHAVAKLAAQNRLDDPPSFNRAMDVLARARSAIYADAYTSGGAVGSTSMEAPRGVILFPVGRADKLFLIEYDLRPASRGWILARYEKTKAGRWHIAKISLVNVKPAKGRPGQGTLTRYMLRKGWAMRQKPQGELASELAARIPFATYDIVAGGDYINLGFVDTSGRERIALTGGDDYGADPENYLKKGLPPSKWERRYVQQARAGHRKRKKV